MFSSKFIFNKWTLILYPIFFTVMKNIPVDGNGSSLMIMA